MASQVVLRIDIERSLDYRVFHNLSRVWRSPTKNAELSARGIRRISGQVYPRHLRAARARARREGCDDTGPRSVRGSKPRLQRKPGPWSPRINEVSEYVSAAVGGRGRTHGRTARDLYVQIAARQARDLRVGQNSLDGRQAGQRQGRRLWRR